MILIYFFSNFLIYHAFLFIFFHYAIELFVFFLFKIISILFYFQTGFDQRLASILGNWLSIPPVLPNRCGPIRACIETY